jgi:PAS domain S-box-containing protein
MKKKPPDEISLSFDQLMSYAKDLAKVYRSEKERRRDLETLNDQLRRYALDIKTTISDLKEAQRALADEKERLAVTLQSIADSVIATDIAGDVVLINTIAKELTGWADEEAVGRPIGDVFQVSDLRSGRRWELPLGEVVERGRIIATPHDLELAHRGGGTRLIESNFAPIRDSKDNVIGMVVVFRDVTLRRRLEEEARKAEKAEYLGILAGGIGHDFNNMITTVLGNILGVEQHCEEQGKEDILEALERATDAAYRASDLAKQLITFSKSGAPVKRAGSIEELVQDTAKFVLGGSEVKVDFKTAGEISPVEMDAGQVSQVLANLFINAKQAMPGGGSVVLGLGNIEVHEETHLPLLPGDYVEILVKDHGVGITEEHLAKVFEPFFTTKESGSGLGLPMAFSTIRNHGGHISVESRVGAGTTFRIYLPASEAEPVVEEEVEEAQAAGRGRILVMDDEGDIRLIIKESLEYFGHEVALSEDGADAVRFYQEAMEAGSPFDIVILDLNVPRGMGGREVLGKLRAMDPGVRAIVLSGADEQMISEQLLADGFAGMVPKPFAPGELNKEIVRLMGA